MKELNETHENLNEKKSNKYTYDPIEELELKVNKSDKEDYEEIIKLLTVILPYPGHELG